MIATTIESRRIVRAAVGAHRSCPVVVVAGAAAPELVGESYYWTWGADPNGTRVRTSRGRSMWRTHYWPSTLRVEVGIEWLATAGASVAPANDAARVAA